MASLTKDERALVLEVSGPIGPGSEGAMGKTAGRARFARIGIAVAVLVALAGVGGPWP